MGKFDDAMAAARRGGATATLVGRTQAWGTRPMPGGNASEAYAQTSASGVGPRSVWTGPRRAARPGEPILRRAQSA